MQIVTLVIRTNKIDRVREYMSRQQDFVAARTLNRKTVEIDFQARDYDLIDSLSANSDLDYQADLEWEVTEIR